MTQTVQTNGVQPLSKTWELSLYELQRTPQVASSFLRNPTTSVPWNSACTCVNCYGGIYFLAGGTQSSSSLPQEAITDGLEIAVSPRSLHSELMCPICLDMLKNTMTTKECLHRFCADCIITALRSGWVLLRCGLRACLRFWWRVGRSQKEPWTVAYTPTRLHQ